MGNIMYLATATMLAQLNVWVPVIAAVVSAAGVVVVAIFTTWRRVPQDLQIEYDKDLRSQRISHYKTLWSRTLPLAKYPQSRPLAYDSANKSAPPARFERLLRKLLPHDDGAEDRVVDSIESLSISLRDWYFEGGGLFLSESTRDAYFDLQDGLKIVLQKGEKGEGRWPPQLDEKARELDIHGIVHKRDHIEDKKGREERKRYQQYEQHLRKHLDRGKDWKAPLFLVRIAISQPDMSAPNVPEDLHFDLMRLSHSLRTSLAKDVLTREKPYFSRGRT